MTVNLIHTTISNDDVAEGRAERDWQAITAITGVGGVAGLLPLAETTVDAIARLVEAAVLSNGQVVTSCPRDASDEWSHESHVSSFGPSLLREETLRQLRALLEQDENGTKAVALLDLIVERGLQIRFSGQDHCFSRMVAVNWPADDVEINRTQSNMARMFRVLGLGDTERENSSETIPLEVFEKAVNDNGLYTDMPDRLEAFIACARRQGSTHVYWA